MRQRRKPGDPRSSSGLSSTADTVEPDRAADPFSLTTDQGSELASALDDILSHAHRVVQYDVVEVTLWDEERLCCVTQEWRGSRAYTWEPGGVYEIDEGYVGWIAHYRRPLFVPDVKERNDIRPKMDTPDYPFRSYVGVPLQIRDRFVGTLGVFSARSEAFTKQDLLILQVTGNQVAMALESTSLREEMQRRAAELTSLATVSATVSESLDLDHVLHAIASAALELVGCQRSAIFVLDEMEEVLKLEMTLGLSEDYAEQSKTLPLVRDGRACAVVTGHPLIISDVLTDTSPFGYVPVSEREGFRAFADLPLKRAKRVIGMLSAMYTEPHDFSPIEVELLTALADQAAIAIENARLYAETDYELQRQIEALDGLEQVSHQINAVLDVRHVLPVVLEEATQLGQAVCGAIALRDVSTEDLRLEAVMDYSQAGQERIRKALQAPTEHPILAQVLDSDQPVVTSDGAGFEDSTRSVLILPIFYAEALAGLIFLESDRPDNFDQRAVRFVESLATQTAIAIGNDRRDKQQRRLTDSVRHRADQLAMVLEVSRALRSDRPVGDILEEIAYAIQESVGFDVVMVGVLEDNPPHNHWVTAVGVPITFLEQLRQTTHPWADVSQVMDEQFRISQSYYIPAEHQSSWVGRLEIYDSGETQDVIRTPGRWHAQDVLLVPMVGPGGDTHGLLSVSRPRDGATPDRATVEALEIFAAQAGLAIENAQMVDELERRADTLALFNKVTRAATAQLELDDVLGTILEMVPDLLGYDHSVIFLLEPESGRYELRAVHGLDLDPIAGLGFAPGEGLVGLVAESGMPQAVTDLSLEPETGLSELKRSVGGLLMCPLATGGEVVGVLGVGSKETNLFSPTEVATLSALSDQVAAAVEHARLFDQVSRFSQELEQRVEARTQELAAAMSELTVERDRVETLYRITAELSTSLDLDHVLNRALSLVVDAVKAEQAFIFLLDLQTGDLLCRAALGEHDEASYVGKKIRFSSGEGLAGWVIENREGGIVSDTRQDERWEEPREGSREYRSALGVPLTAGDAVLGALLLFYPDPDYFVEEHLRLVEAAATQVASAINNAELYKMIVDQTDRLGRMLREQEVEASTSQAILEGVADGVMVADDQGQVILFNAAAERILDLPRDQAMGRSTGEMLGLYGSQAQDWMEAVANWAEAKQYDEDEYLATRLDMGEHIVSVHLAPVLKGDEFLGSVSVFRDVTVEVEAERAKSEFVSMVSHELRTPMTSIKGYADLLLMSAVGPLTEEQERFLTIIKSNADRLTMLVNDLLDISRIESGRLALTPTVCRVEDMIASVLTGIRPKAQEKNLALEVDMPQVLPEVFADPDRVIQILTNLVGNACRYTPAEGEICLSVRLAEGELHVSVRDTGIGISEEDQQRLFSRFFRADDPLVQDAPGTGLGLSITKSLVEMQGGEIWVDSELGVGSTFSFSLPTASAGKEAGVEGKAGRLSRSKKVLVVEDDADVANLIKMHLAGNGREVLIASRGEEALELAQSERPDLITLDVLLPDTDGFGVLEDLKANPLTQGIPVVVVSVLPDREDGIQLGAVDYITKPIDEQQLVRAVRRVLVRQGTVLVVDDDAQNLSMLQKVLDAHQFGVCTISQGKQAVDKACEVKPALILLDLKLRDVDGYTVLKQLKHLPETVDIPVIVMTGSTVIDDAKRKKIMALGAASFVAKPFSVDGLIDQIETVLWQNGGSAGKIH